MFRSSEAAVWKIKLKEMEIPLLAVYHIPSSEFNHIPLDCLWMIIQNSWQPS